MLWLRTTSQPPTQLAQNSQCSPSDLADVKSDSANVSLALL